jgi:hypothetical protein
MRRVERIQRLRNTIPELQNARLTLLASLVDSGDDERLIAEYEANERSQLMALIAAPDLQNQANRIEALQAKVDQLERYLFAARANIITLESKLKAVSASCDAYAEESGRLAHRLAALAGEGDEA